MKKVCLSILATGLIIGSVYFTKANACEKNIPAISVKKKATADKIVVRCAENEIYGVFPFINILLIQ